MFAAMGLSGIVPVTHGLMLYGFASMNRRIGLSWLVLQGVLYIVGAGLYAVSIQRSNLHQMLAVELSLIRLAYRSVCILADMICTAAAIRSSMS